MLVVAGVVLTIVALSGLGQAIAITLVGIGLVAITSLIFLAVGLSEDRDRAREAARRAKPATDHHRAAASGTRRPYRRRRIRGSG
jgi:hypothetical protein